jgi:hypothetical protein
MEYLMDYATPGTKQAGEELVNRELAAMPGDIGKTACDLVSRVRKTERDVFV